MTRVGWIILLLCVAVDFADPMLPGAVRLDPSEAIAGVPTDTSAMFSVPSPVQESTLDRRDPTGRLERHQGGGIRVALLERGWTRAVQPVRHSADDLTVASPAEDH